MPLMHWDTNMSVGVEEIDTQHKTLIDLINQTCEAIQRQDRARLAELVDRMAAYGRTHFATEERHMRETASPASRSTSSSTPSSTPRWTTSDASWTARPT